MQEEYKKVKFLPITCRISKMDLSSMQFLEQSIICFFRISGWKFEESLPLVQSEKILYWWERLKTFRFQYSKGELYLVISPTDLKAGLSSHFFWIGYWGI
jgi:hypothetical protein